MEFEGKIIFVAQKQSGVSKTSGKEWYSQDYVIETVGEQYPKKMSFTIFGEDKIQQAALMAGEFVKVLFDIDAREFNGRWYNSIRAWKIERNVQQQSAQPVQQENKQNNTQQATQTNIQFQEHGANGEDLPF